MCESLTRVRALCGGSPPSRGGRGSQGLRARGPRRMKVGGRLLVPCLGLAAGLATFPRRAQHGRACSDGADGYQCDDDRSLDRERRPARGELGDAEDYSLHPDALVGHPEVGIFANDLEWGVVRFTRLKPKGRARRPCSSLACRAARVEIGRAGGLLTFASSGKLAMVSLDPKAMPCRRPKDDEGMLVRDRGGAPGRG